VHDFRARGVGEKRFERAARLAGFVPPCGARYSGRGRKLDGGDARAEPFGLAFAGRGLEPDRDFCFLRHPGKKIADGRGRIQALGIERGRGGGDRRGQFLEQRGETQLGVEFAQGVRVGLAALEFVERERDGRVGGDLRELL
jgi:hypothetical protein